MKKSPLPHSGHNKHLCYLNNLGFQISSPKQYRDLVKDARYLCKICGRVANSPTNLCKPVIL